MYLVITNWTVRSNQEGQINRKPEDRKLTERPNKYKTEGPKMTIRPKIK